ncbi:MAG TPA: DUF167 domain-containing protein [Longimicrobiales bacterium]
MKIIERGDAVRINVHVQPRASRSEVVGQHGDAVKVRLAAPPVEGAANEELCRFMAKTVGVAASRVTIVAGETSRNKALEIEGVTAEQVQTALARATRRK